MRTTLVVLCLPLLVCSLMGQAPAQNQSGFTPGTQSPNAATPAPANQGAYDPLLDLPPLPAGRVTLIGGTVVRLDEVMNRMVIRPFGAKREVRVRLDTRTHFYRDGSPVTERDIREGQRVYLDTMLNGDRVFAKSIWIRTSADAGSSRGQVLRIDLEHNVLTVRDELSDQPLKLQVSPTTPVHRGDQTASLSELREGALVAVNFGAQREVREITLLASPGAAFTFAGRVTYLDLSRRLIALVNQSDGKSYDVYMDAIPPSLLRQLREGVNVSVSAVFDGERYAARSVDLPAAGAVQGPH